MKTYGIDALSMNEIRQMSATSLAFIGDGVYDLYIRTKFITRFPRASSGKLNHLKIQCVNAATQSKIAHVIMPMLNEEELAILKRGRNAKSQTVPKNAKLTDYKYATGFEALLGYLMLCQKKERLKEFLEIAFDVCDVKA